LPIRPEEIKWGEDELAKRVELGKIPNILVREFERAIFIRDGKIFEEFGPGRHVTSKLGSITKTNMIYVSMVPFKLKWGLPETMSKDNVSVGCSGSIELQIDNAKMFWAQVMGSRNLYTKTNLRERILTNLQGVIRSELANLTVQEIYLERDILIAAVRVRLQELFEAMGIDYKRLEIVGINISEKIKNAIESQKLHEIELKKKKGEQELELSKVSQLAKEGVDAAKMRELEIAGENPEVLGKKYESEAYKDALKTSRTQEVKIISGVETPKSQESREAPQKEQSCPSCGKGIQPDFTVCPYCGQDLKPGECSKCGKELQPEFTVCPYCGKKR